MRVERLEQKLQTKDDEPKKVDSTTKIQALPSVAGKDAKEQQQQQREARQAARLGKQQTRRITLKRRRRVRRMPGERNQKRPRPSHGPGRGS